MATIRSLRVMMYVDHSKVSKGMRATEKKVAQGARNISRIMAGAFVGAGAGLGVSFMRALQVAARRQKIEVSMAVLGGTSKLMKDIRKMARQSSVPTDEWLQGTNRLLGAGIQVEKINGLMESMANLAAGTGNSIRELGLVYSQVFSKGKLQGEEMLQFMERNVNLMPALMETLNKSAREIVDMQAKGLITPDDVAEAMRLMTTGDGRFAGMDAALGNTLSGAFTKFTNRLNDGLERVGDTLIPVFTELFNQLGRLVEPGGMLTVAFEMIAVPVAIIVAGVTGLLSLFNSINDATMGWLGTMVAIAAIFTAISAAILAIKVFISPVLAAIAGFKILLGIIMFIGNAIMSLITLIATLAGISMPWAAALVAAAGALTLLVGWMMRNSGSALVESLRKEQKELVKKARGLENMRDKSGARATGAGALFGSAEAAAIFSGEAEDLQIQRDILATLERIADIEDQIKAEQSSSAELRKQGTMRALESQQSQDFMPFPKYGGY